MRIISMDLIAFNVFLGYLWGCLVYVFTRVCVDRFMYLLRARSIFDFPRTVSDRSLSYTHTVHFSLFNICNNSRPKRRLRLRKSWAKSKSKTAQSRNGSACVPVTLLGTTLKDDTGDERSWTSKYVFNKNHLVFRRSERECVLVSLAEHVNVQQQS